MSPHRTVGPHFFVAPDAVDGDRARLGGDDARHLTQVLRARSGDPVSVADGAGTLWQARVAGIADEVRLVLTDRWDVPAARPRVTVAHALPKGRKLDEVVQRLTEVGVDGLVPVHSERSQVRLAAQKAERAQARWRAVALAAAKQSRRVRLLDVGAVGEWATAFEGSSTGAVLWEDAETPLGAVVESWPDDVEEIVLAVGPEGGLTPDEVAGCGLPAALLGVTILRTETAGLVGASIAMHRLGRLG